MFYFYKISRSLYILVATYKTYDPNTNTIFEELHNTPHPKNCTPRKLPPGMGESKKNTTPSPTQLLPQNKLPQRAYYLIYYYYIIFFYYIIIIIILYKYLLYYICLRVFVYITKGNFEILKSQSFISPLFYTYNFGINLIMFNIFEQIKIGTERKIY